MANDPNAIVIQNIEISPGLAVLRVVPDGWDLPEFTPGQFAVLGLPGRAPRCRVCDSEDDPRDPDKLIKRAYSIASSSVSTEYIEFYIVLVPSGSLTPRLFSLTNGDRLWLSAKISGLFTLDDAPDDKHIILISTGTGLAPYMSMLRTQLTCGAQRRYAVLHGARHSWDLGYRGELMTLRRLCSNFAYAPIISRPDEESATWGGEAGYIQDLWNRGQASASALQQLKGTREQVQETRTAEGAGRKITRLKRRGEARPADRATRFDVGDEQAAREPTGDVREALGESAIGEGDQPKQAGDQAQVQKPPKISDDFTSRLLAARKRAREKMDDKDKGQ